jgi:ABC-type dipeptide/oligopeptide/nickel transport system ATPase component
MLSHESKRRGTVTESNLIMIVGQEGSGKSTTVRALLKVTPQGAQIDAEDVGTVNPWRMDEAFIRLLHANVADLTRNFWDAGYQNVIAGSFMSNYSDYLKFRARLDRDANVSIIHLCATKQTRDVRRIERDKETSEEWRDMVDRADPEDSTLRNQDGGYRYVRIANDALTAADTVAIVRRAIPEVYKLIDPDGANSS